MLLAEISTSEWVMVAATVGLFVVALIALMKRSDVEITPQPLAVRGEPPGNAEIQLTLKQMDRRIKSLEDWQASLLAKLDADKQEILRAGEHRTEKLHDRINEVLEAVSEQRGQLVEISRRCGMPRT